MLLAVEIFSDGLKESEEGVEEEEEEEEEGEGNQVQNEEHSRWGSFSIRKTWTILGLRER